MKDLTELCATIKQSALLTVHLSRDELYSLADGIRERDEEIKRLTKAGRYLMACIYGAGESGAGA